MTAKELQEKIEAKRARVREVLDETKAKSADGKPSYDFSKAKAAWLGAEVVAMDDAPAKGLRVAEAIQTETAELNELAGQLETLLAAEKGLSDEAERIRRDRGQQPAGGLPGNGEKRVKTLGEMVVEHERFKAWRHGSREPILLDVPAKTLFETGNGWAPESTRTGFVAEAVVRPVQVLDILPKGNTGQAAVVYMEETTRTHAAAGTAEGAQKPESTFELTERSVTVREIADSVPVTEIQLEDVAMVQSYLDGRLRFGIQQKLDEHAIDQGADTDSIIGILNNASIQDQPLGADTLIDAILKAMTLIRLNGRAAPTHVLINSLDWQEIRLARDESGGAGTGSYLWGPPSESGPPRIWGLPIVLADVLTATSTPGGQALVGSFEPAWITLFERRGIRVEQGVVGDQFRENRRTIRASGRWALVIYRPPAFCTVSAAT